MSRLFVLRRNFVRYIRHFFELLVSFAHFIRIYLRKARHDTTLCYLGRGEFGVTHHLFLGALCTVCGMSRVHRLYVLRCFFHKT